jgi:lipoprotein-releasing system ATP-binding protein
MSSLLRVCDLHKSFTEGGSKIHVLQGVDFELGEGERLAVIGESGVGKSTLLHIIGTLDRPTSGEILCLNFAIGKSALSFSFTICCPIFPP